MIKSVLILCVLLLSGCTVKYPETANLNLEITDQPKSVYTDSFASIRGLDARERAEVIVYKLESEPVVWVASLTPPVTIITEEIEIGLREQGIQIDRDAPVRIELQLDRLLVTVAKSKRLYNTEAVSQITLHVRYGKNSVTKEYIRQSSEESVFLPKIEHLEGLLNDQLSDLATTILSDKDLREFIIKK